MPTFYREDLDIEVDDFLDACSSTEIEEVIQWLKDSYCLPQNVVTSEAEQSYQDTEFDGALMNLVGNRFKLSVDDEQTIMRIANKIV
jgi:hypothetical protein